MVLVVEVLGENCVEWSCLVDGGEFMFVDDVLGVSCRLFMGVFYFGVDLVDDFYKWGWGFDWDFVGLGCEEVVMGVGDGVLCFLISLYICRVDFFER